jgi:hypothetical protein
MIGVLGHEYARTLCLALEQPMCCLPSTEDDHSCYETHQPPQMSLFNLWPHAYTKKLIFCGGICLTIIEISLVPLTIMLYLWLRFLCYSFRNEFDCSGRRGVWLVWRPASIGCRHTANTCPPLIIPPRDTSRASR